MTHNKKTNITFLNLAAQSPTIELNLALSEKVYIESKKTKHLFFMCDRALSSCSVNINNSLSICNICRYKAKQGFKYFNDRNHNSELIKIKREDLFESEVKEKTYKEIILGVNSTIGSQLRLDDMKLLNKEWKIIKERMIKSSVGLFNYFDNFLKKNNVENFIIFNGRVNCARPLKHASEINNVDYILFDGALNGLTPYYSKNQMFHSIGFEKINALKSYVKHFHESRELASRYIYNKQNKLSILRDVIYTKNQSIGYLDRRILKLKKQIITIFVSSDDEYRYLGSDFSEEPIVDQLNEINKLIEFEDSLKYDFVIKMHPNQNRSHTSILKKYKILSNKVLVIFPENKTDSYELMRRSKIIINFSSSIGVEANYLRKPVIQIGPSKWMGLPTANFVKSAVEAIEIIKNEKFKIMPIRASIAFFVFNLKANFELPQYKYVEDGVYTYSNKFINAPLRLRLLALPSKLYNAKLRGDLKILFKLNILVANLIFGRTKV